MNPITIAVVTDLHLGPPGAPPSGARRSDIAADLLDRAVRLANESLRPDVLLVLGDLVDAGSAPEAAALYGSISLALRRSRAPVVVLPGNHDGPAFADFFPPPGRVDLAGFRFVCFLDPEEPGWNARRDAGGFERMREARRGWDGPLVALQHVPVFPPGATECPYAYLNAADVIEAMREQRFHLALSGHYHEGAGPVKSDGLCFHATPALCEAPFAFDTVWTDGVTLEVERHALLDPLSPSS